MNNSAANFKLDAQLEIKIQKMLDGWQKDLILYDFKLFSVADMIVTPKVRLKCMYGCPNYKNAKNCPPTDTLTPEQCENYLHTYSTGIILRFYPNKNQLCPDIVQTNMLELERQIFLSNKPFALAIFPKHCSLCNKCDINKPCSCQTKARPSISSMCIDILGTVTKLGLEQKIISEKNPSHSWYYVGIVLID